VADFLDSFFASQGFPALTGSVETNSLTALKSLVMTGRYVSLLAEAWVGPEMRSGDIVALPVPGPPLRRQAGLITRGAAEQRPVVMRAIELMREVCLQWQVEQEAALQSKVTLAALGGHEALEPAAKSGRSAVARASSRRQ
jgi:DNA-binding transcriptional LysR family regulator